MAKILLVIFVLVLVVNFVHCRSPRIGRTAAPSWVSGVRLDGSRTSYVQFSAWSICRNASLSFEFRTRRPTALLIYADDEGRMFVDVRLVRGAVRLRYRLSTSAEDTPTTAGSGLDDSRWHAVRLRSYDGSRLVLTVDGASSAASRAADVRRRASTIRLTQGTFVGGLSASARRQAADLAVPTVAFERRLAGSLRNFRLSRCSASSTAGAATPSEPLDGRGMTTAAASDGEAGKDDRCETDNPCLHGGLCVTSDAGPLCECDRTDFDGLTCSIGLSRRVLYTLDHLLPQLFIDCIVHTYSTEGISNDDDDDYRCIPEKLEN